MYFSSIVISSDNLRLLLFILFKENGIVFRTISDAMQGGVDHNTLETCIGDLDNWMSSGGDQAELDEILSELDGTYESPRGFSVFDDDWGWTT